jgi:hypothetical protein
MISNEIMPTECSRFYCDFFYCKLCDYRTCKKSNFKKHLLTSKHKTLINVNENSQKVAAKIFTCKICNKNFKSYVGLWKHNKKCNVDKNVVIESTNISKQIDIKTPDKDQLIIMLVKQNMELMEILKDRVNNTTNNNINTNSL